MEIELRHLWESSSRKSYFAMPKPIEFKSFVLQGVWLFCKSQQEIFGLISCNLIRLIAINCCQKRAGRIDILKICKFYAHPIVGMWFRVIQNEGEEVAAAGAHSPALAGCEIRLIS